MQSISNPVEALLIFLLTAETIPFVTVLDRSAGFPIAITDSPTIVSSESPNVAGVRSVEFTLITAISVFASLPMIFAEYCSPSTVSTVCVPVERRTCAFVTI